MRRHRVHHRGDRPSDRRNTPRHCRHRCRQACHHGQCRSRCDGWGRSWPSGARRKGVIYSMAYGDQPALICELVDWAHAIGFEVTAAGKGMNFEPRYRYSTPDTVWGFFGWSEEEVAKGDFNPKMYNSFTDGTKAAIEMAAVANGTGLDCPRQWPRIPAGRIARSGQGVPPGKRWRPHAVFGLGRNRRQPGAGRTRSLQQHPLWRLRCVQSALASIRVPASSSMAF